jgi:uncharacterized protein YbbC (DUF1343 family)
MNEVHSNTNRYHQLQLSEIDKQNIRIALVCNNASLTEAGITTRMDLLANGFNLVKLFSPEHGLNAAGEDGSWQADGIDQLSGLPITSLYGNRLAPSEADLHDIDLVIFDIPDVGCRFYTYLWTMTYIMESCVAYNVPLLIVDRPNPIGGDLDLAEGPMLDEKNCSSFIGRWRIPVRHSCTLGELALYFAATKMTGLQLQVIPWQNWQRQPTREMIFTPTSPAIQKRSTALLYPGMGLLEGTNVNEGRGTDTPFELFGAPWINADALQKAFTKAHQPGIITTPVSYIPVAGLYANETCQGLQITVTNEADFRPVQMGISLVKTILQCYPAEATERLYCTVANPSGKGHLDKLLGIPDAFIKLKKGATIPTAVAAEWKELMRDYLLYE